MIANDRGAPRKEGPPVESTDSRQTTHRGDFYGRFGPILTDLTEAERDRYEALEFARGLAGLGCPVFVAHPDSSPLGFRLPPRWQTQGADPRRVDAWEPGLALCMVTGCGADVIDIDPRNGGTLDALRAALRPDRLPPAYAEVDTPSGGQHYYVKSESIGKQLGLLPGVDFLGGDAEGRGRGFVFMPPTVRVSKATGLPEPYRLRWTANGVEYLAEALGR